jgi:lysine/ornithine N-monooxygenase
LFCVKGTEVTDVIARADGAILHWRDGTQAGKDQVDRLVIATGYHTSGGMNTPGQVANAAGAIHGHLGSSLSAIDAAVTLACHHR